MLGPRKKFFISKPAIWLASLALVSTFGFCGPVLAEEAQQEQAKQEDDNIISNRFFSQEEGESLTDFELAAIQEKLKQEIDQSELEPAVQEEAKKYIEITADQIFYDQEKRFYEAVGNAQGYIPSKNATVYADTITFNDESKLVEAKGEVKVKGDKETITGSYASFNIDEKSYKLTEPRLFISGLKLKARVSQSTFSEDFEARAEEQKKKKNKKYGEEIIFDEGIIALENPKSIFFSQSAPTRYTRQRNYEGRRRVVDWSDLPDKPIFRYSAEKIIFDNTRKVNNLRIEGARIHYKDRFSVPAPVAITTTVGEASNSQFLGSIFGNNTRIGGFAIGPRFYKSVDQGIFALAPIAQIDEDSSFGGGAIASFNTPNDRTALMLGYGSLEDRFIARAHQDLPFNLQIDYLKNQNFPSPEFGSQQVGQIIQGSHRFKLDLPFLDDRTGLRVYNAVGYAQDNDDLYNSRRLDDLQENRDTARGDDFDSFRTEHTVAFYTKPILRYGNELYNASLRGRVQGSVRFYGTGDSLSIGRAGPALDIGLGNLTFETSFLAGRVGGESPFLFDQFIDGNNALLFDGDYKINDWVSVGAFLSYNIDDGDFSRTQLRSDFGPKDFKVRLAYDTIRRQLGLGLNMIFGDPIEYDELAVRI